MNSLLGFCLAIIIPLAGIIISVYRLLRTSYFPLETFERREKINRMILIGFILWFVLGFPVGLTVKLWDKLDLRDVYSIALIYLMGLLGAWWHFRRQHFTNRQTAILYGVIVGCGVGIVLCHALSL